MVIKNNELKAMGPEVEKKLLKAQKNEITQHFIYAKLSKSAKDPHNQSVLKQIADEELKHHNICLNFTCTDVQPNRIKVWMYQFLSLVFGVTFGLQFIERNEERENVIYAELSDTVKEAVAIARDEIRHEKKLLSLIEDKRLKYNADIVRGMNVAIVGITGTLAGLTFAIQNTELVVETVIIIGIIMSLSVMSTEYLAAKAESHIKRPLNSLLYAGIANLFTILLLLLPYILLQNIYMALVVTIMVALIVIYVFAFYISVVQGTSIRKRFLEMASISLGITAIAFGIGLLARLILHIEVV